MAKKKSPNTVESVPLMLRMPPDIHAWIKSMAEVETRSLNSQVVAILKEAKQQKEQSKQVN